MRHETTNAEYGQKIRDIINNSGDSQVLAAKKLGITDTGLRYVLTGRNRFSLESLIKFCKIYDASIDNLYFKEKEDSAAEIDSDALAEIFETIEAWENRKKFKLTIKYKTTLALALYPDVIIEEAKEKKEAKVINFLDAVEKLGQIQKSA